MHFKFLNIRNEKNAHTKIVDWLTTESLEMFFVKKRTKLYYKFIDEINLNIQTLGNYPEVYKYLSNELFFFKEIKQGYHKKSNIQLSLDLFFDKKQKEKAVSECNLRIINFLTKEIDVLSQLKEQYFNKQKECPKLDWLGDKKLFLVFFVIFYNKKWLGKKGQKISRIELFRQLSSIFGISFPYLDSSISKIKKLYKQNPTQSYPFIFDFYKKYFLEIIDN